MIAANFRKFPQAMALQMPLRFARALVWALKRPSTRVLRAIRAERAAAFKVGGRIRHIEKQAVPAWVKVARAKARKLGQLVREAQQALGFVVPVVKTGFAGNLQRLASMRPAPRCPIVLEVLA